MKLVLATRNTGKVKEIKDKLIDFSIEIETLQNYPQVPEIAEEGKTFQENATLKAKTVFEWTHLPSLADDSGLEIDFLGGKPGIYSSRWGNSDPERIAKVIRLLQDARIDQRKARFVCSMCLAVSGEEIFSTKGTCPGQIILTPRGNSGFGYDPIFIPDGYNLTFAELGSEIKNRISHRAVALGKMISFIKSRMK